MMVATGVVAAGESPQGGASINLHGTSFEALLDYVGRIQGKPVILCKEFPRKQTVDVITPAGVEVPADRLNEVVGNILRQEGFALVEGESVIQVLPAGETRANTTLLKGADRDTGVGGAQPVTRVVALEHSAAGVVAQALEPLKGENGRISVAPGSNHLVITDYKATVDRLVAVAEELDTPPAKPVTEVYRLQNVQVEELAQYLKGYNESMVKPRGADMGRVQPRMSADPRQNAVVMIGSEDDVTAMRRFVAKLDNEIVAAPTYYVYQVKNGDAAEIAKVLNAAMAEGAAPGAAGGQEGVALGEARVVPDLRKNALLIKAYPGEYEEILAILGKLDETPRQVFIEAAVVELTNDRMRELGAEIATATQVSEGETAGFGGTGWGLSALQMKDGLSRIPGSPQSSPLGGGLIAGLWQDDYSTVPLLVRAGETDSDVDILAMPILTTTDHTPAQITIEEQRPYDEVTLNTDGNATSRTFGGYHQAGVQLQIVPHISGDREVRLVIEQTTSEFLANTENPPKTERSAKTSLTVPDGQTAIIGGLTKTRDIEDLSGVPVVCRIPVVGRLFSREISEDRKKNLCLFITPHIIDDYEDMARLLARREPEHSRLIRHHREAREARWRKARSAPSGEGVQTRPAPAPDAMTDAAPTSERRASAPAAAESPRIPEGDTPDAYDAALEEGDVDAAARLLDSLPQ
jgi:general secretion pathway protein D